MFVVSRARQVRKADNLTAICVDQRCPTGGPWAGSGLRLDLLRPPSSLRFIFNNLNFTKVMT
jgi:hypothetical protein